MESKEWDKTAAKYYEEVLSPIKNSEKTPLYKDLEKLYGKKTIADLGCGLGELLPLLSKHFKQVIALDYSKGMIERAKEKNKEYTNIEYYQKDMDDLNDFKENFDAIISVNAIITPEIKKLTTIFEQIHNTLKENGTFICIVPAMEGVLYQSLLVGEEQFAKEDDPKKVKRAIHKYIRKQEHDFFLATYDYNQKQKAYYRFELIWRLKKAGFKNIIIKKVTYPWEEIKEAGQTYFPKEEPVWDWYAICKK